MKILTMMGEMIKTIEEVCYKEQPFNSNYNLEFYGVGNASEEIVLELLK